MSKVGKYIFGLAVFIIGYFLYTQVLPYQLSGQKDFSITPENLLGDYNPNDQKATFHGSDFLSYKIPDPKLYQNVLGTGGDKRIEVDLTNQRLYAYENDRKVFDFLVSTGKWGRTPTGVFEIWTKLRYTKMSGGNPAIGTYYYLPNVPYVMFFANNEISRSRGFSLHGTYWHNNFGHPMSHGCVNMKTSEVEQLYYWAQPDLRGKASINATNDNPGTKIIIYGEAPAE